MGFRGKQIAVLLTVAVTVALATSLIHGLLATRTEVAAARDEAEMLARTLAHLAGRAAARSPASDPLEGLTSDPALRGYAEAVIGYSPITLYLAIVDGAGVARFHSDRGQVGRIVRPAEALDDLASRSAAVQFVRLVTGRRVLVSDVPLGTPALGSARVALSSLLLRDRILAGLLLNATLAAALVLVALLGSLWLANRLLAPLEVLRRELARIDPAAGAALDLRSELDVTRLAEFFASVGRKLAAESKPSDPPPEPPAGLLGDLADAALVLDLDRRVLSLNQPAAQLLGGDRETFIGRPLERTAPAIARALRAVVEAGLASGQVETRSLRLARDERAVEHIVSAHPLGLGGDARGILITARDAERLARLGSQLSYSQKLTALGRLTSGVAHEIKNPLHAMVLQTELLRRELGDAEPRLLGRLDVLDQEIRRLNRVIQGFLDFTRPEELKLETVHLPEVIDGVLELLSARLDDGTIRVERDCEPDLPPVQGSRELLHQVFLNLLANACEAMPHGGRVRLETRRATRGGVIATVEDEGSGIPDDALPHIFDLYYTTKREGSGIGLSIVYRIVQLHGGEIAVESRPGAGTRFVLTLPEVRA